MGRKFVIGIITLILVLFVVGGIIVMNFNDERLSSNDNSKNNDSNDQNGYVDKSEVIKDDFQIDLVYHCSEARDINSNMIILAPQLDDWGMQSATLFWNGEGGWLLAGCGRSATK